MPFYGQQSNKKATYPLVFYFLPLYNVSNNSMYTGALIFLVGIIFGYSIHFFPVARKTNRVIKKLTSRKAKVIDTSPDIDLGIE